MSVLPQTTIDVHLVVRQTASPGGTATALPSSISEVTVGESCVVEIWMQDLYTASVTGGPSLGLCGGLFDVSFDPAVAQATALRHDATFNYVHTGTIDNTIGTIDNLGAGTTTMNVGVAPNYARLGNITFDATAGGRQEFTLDLEEVARIGAGGVDPSQIRLGTAMVEQVEQESLAFTIQTFVTLVQVDAVIRGAAMRPEPVSADSGWLPSGTLEVVVDDLASPTRLGSSAASLTWSRMTRTARSLPASAAWRASPRAICGSSTRGRSPTIACWPSGASGERTTSCA